MGRTDYVALEVEGTRGDELLFGTNKLGLIMKSYGSTYHFSASQEYCDYFKLVFGLNLAQLKNYSTSLELYVMASMLPDS